MDEFKFFKNFKERGEWVEARFMADAMRHGYKVLKPWGDSQPFDVALAFGRRIVRVQVKSTSCRTGTGYFCSSPTISATPTPSTNSTPSPPASSRRTPGI